MLAGRTHACHPPFCLGPLLYKYTHTHIRTHAHTHRGMHRCTCKHAFTQICHTEAHTSTIQMHHKNIHSRTWMWCAKCHKDMQSWTKYTIYTHVKARTENTAFNTHKMHQKSHGEGTFIHKNIGVHRQQHTHTQGEKKGCSECVCTNHPPVTLRILHQWWIPHLWGIQGIYYIQKSDKIWSWT